MFVAKGRNLLRKAESSGVFVAEGRDLLRKAESGNSVFESGCCVGCLSEDTESRDLFCEVNDSFLRSLEEAHNVLVRPEEELDSDRVSVSPPRDSIFPLRSPDDFEPIVTEKFEGSTASFFDDEESDVSSTIISAA